MRSIIYWLCILRYVMVSLSVSFLIYKTKILIVYLPHGIIIRIKGDH